ncbi:MAG: PIN domain-containing protein [Acidobacteriia bacterium]|nr:PIN domain-containing protein [Terriglobia bacterium]
MLGSLPGRVSTLVVPARTLSASSDEPANRFLECAEAAKADFLVTGNKQHFPEQWKAIRVVNAREFPGQFVASFLTR